MLDSLHQQIRLRLQFSQNDDGFLCVLLVSVTLTLVALAYFGTIFVIKLATKKYAKLCAEHPEWNLKRSDDSQTKEEHDFLELMGSSEDKEE